MNEVILSIENISEISVIEYNGINEDTDHVVMNIEDETSNIDVSICFANKKVFNRFARYLNMRFREVNV